VASLVVKLPSSVIMFSKKSTTEESLRFLSFCEIPERYDRVLVTNKESQACNLWTSLIKTRSTD
jgi:hypothetical protein